MTKGKKLLQPGSVVSGKAVEVKDYGVFFDYEESTKILVLITEMSQDVVEHPSDLVSIGDWKELKILRYNRLEGVYAATMML